MATRTRGSGVIGYAIGLVIFVILFVIALVSAILLYTKWDATQVELAGARKDAAKIVSKADRANQMNDAFFTATGGMVEGGAIDTVVRRMSNEITELRQMAIGNNTDNAQVIKEKAKNAGWPIDSTYVREMQRLQNELADARNQREVIQKERDALAAKLKAVSQEIATRTDALSKAEQKLAGQFQTVASDWKSDAKKAADAVASLQTQLVEVQNVAAEKLKKKDDSITQMEQEIAALKRRIEELAPPKIGKTEPLDPSRVPDGKVIGAAVDGKVVTINLGRKQHVNLGLTFDVYDRGTTLIDKDASNRPRSGKAIVEVASVSDTSATCRVIEVQRGATINEGDVVANVVYNPNVTLKFYVIGDFDIDNVGRPSGTDRRRIEALIEQWGGKLSDALDPNVDLIITGITPKMPEPLKKDETDPLVIEANAKAKAAWEEYQRVLGQATQYNIPILNQNRFLALVGYYQR